VEDIAVGYPQPLMPNTIAIGDIAAGRPSLPLPEQLEKFLHAATRGVIVLAFGSYFDYIPDGAAHKFCDAFEKLESDGIRVLWKSSRSDLCAGIGNVQVTRWIPQNDLLADKRVILFISHGGFNGLIEAVYHAKPVIVFPLVADQSANANAAVKNGYGIRMDIGDFTADLLLENINRILSDRKYKENAERWSSILRDRRDTAAERVSRAVEHVIKYGDSHLRSGAFELNVLQFFMFDVYAVICTAFLIFVVGLIICCRCSYRKLTKSGRGYGSRKGKSD
jgi:2-hydroxyacylsphingosine 1-beta-galactosyltransferase